LTALQLKGRFRLIDVYTGTISQIAAQQDFGKYFALSYVWGQAMERYSAVTPHNAQSSTGFSTADTPIELQQDLPRTVKDAILLVKNLGGRYLWVDALCINQRNADEKEDIVSQMGVIYLNAYATIIAATGQGSDAGLPPLYDSANRLEIPFTFSVDGHMIKLLRPRPSVGTLLERSKRDSRAWTYQELLLSRRCILVFDSEVAFTCFKGLWREAYVFHCRKLKRRRGRSPGFETCFAESAVVPNLDRNSYKISD
jgi:hypothetical protein